MMRGENNEKREKQIRIAGIDIPALVAPILPDYFSFLVELLHCTDRKEQKWAAGQLTKIVSRMTPQSTTLTGTGEGGVIEVQWKTHEDSNN